jgi:Short C-terminal domain
MAAAPVPPPPASTAAAPAAGTDDRLVQLSKLGDLKNAGVLTEAEFEQEKARILNA